jgi:N-acetylmuramoyl-L-alanine amidase
MVAAALATVLAAGCSSETVVEEDTQPDSTAAAQTGSPWERVVVTGSVVNLRAGPGTSYAVLGRVSRDDTLDVMGASMDWLKVYDSSQSLFAWIYEPLTRSLGFPEQGR